MTLVHEDLVGLTSAIWESVFGVDAYPVDPALVSSVIAGSQTLTGCVNISGAWEGSVSFIVPVPLATVLAATMFGMAEDELDAELVSDAIGELANIAGGNVKGMITDTCELGLPIVAHGIGYSVSVPGTRVVCEAAFEHIGEPFTVVLHSATDLPM